MQVIAEARWFRQSASDGLRELADMYGLNNHDEESENSSFAGVSGPPNAHRPGRIAVWSAVTGLMITIVVAIASGRLGLNERAGHATVLGALGFSVAFAAPFFVSLASFLARDLETRRAVWLASGVLALVLAGFTVFSGVGLLIGAAGVGLITAWWLAREGAGPMGSSRSLALIGWLLFWLGGALLVLWLRDIPMCWNDSTNGPGWVEANTPNECTSDIVDNTEGLLALGGVSIGLAGMALIVRRENDSDTWPISPPQRASSTHRAGT